MMEDFVVRIELDVQIYAASELDAQGLVSRSTTNWDDWNVVTIGKVRKGDLNDNASV
jgi:hypothetical protein